MKYIDLHCDTLMKIVHAIHTGKEEQTLASNTIASIDFKRLRESNALTQFFAIFLPGEKTYKWMGIESISDDEYINLAANLLINSVEENSDVMAMAYNYDDILKNEAENKMSAILTIEDGRSVDGNLEKLDMYHDLGIRLITLTWNYENSIGYPNSNDRELMKRGLKPFGREAVEYMNEIGIIVDVSHLSDGGFYDVAQISKRPFVASHSNARALSPHPRNLTDDMIKVLGEKGGVAGLNFCPNFLNEDIDRENSTIELMVKHLNYMKNAGGEDVIALGSDLDGISGNLEIDGSDKMPLLFHALKKSGWSDDLIEKVAYKNVLRVIKDTLI